jgi:hypothetical protein
MSNSKGICIYIYLKCLLIVGLNFFLLIIFSSISIGNELKDNKASAENKIVNHSVLELNSEVVKFELGIHKSRKFHILVDSPSIVNIGISGEVQKKVSGSWYGRAELDIINVTTKEKIPSWDFNFEFDDNHTSREINAEYILHPGEYEIIIEGTINGYTSENIFEADKLNLDLILRTSKINLADWVPLINKWLDDIGLGDKLRVLASLKGPNFSYTDKADDNIWVKKLFSSLERSKKFPNSKEPKDQFYAKLE